MSARNILTALIVLLITVMATAQDVIPPVEKIGDSIVDPQAMTLADDGSWGTCINGRTYQQDAHTSHLGWQYVAYFDLNGYVCVARRQLPGAAWQILRLTDYATATNDSHNVTAIGICALDGTIHLSFDHHVHPLRYRVSRPGVATEPQTIAWDASLFGPTTSTLAGETLTRVTYPKFISTPGGGLQFCWRYRTSGDGDRMMADYDPATASWHSIRAIDLGTGNYNDFWGVSSRRCSYPNSYDYDSRGRLHMTWTWRERASRLNHDILYAYSDDHGFSWHANDGTPLSTPPRIDSPGILAVELNTLRGLLNDQGQAIDPEGRVHVVMYHATEEATLTDTPPAIGWTPAAIRRYHHYWRDLDGKWHTNLLDWNNGNRPKLLADPDSNLILIYQRAGRLEIARATADRQWKDWKIIHQEPGPFFNEMLFDRVRWQTEGILSVKVQERPTYSEQPTPLRILDFRLNAPAAVRNPWVWN